MLSLLRNGIATGGAVADLKPEQEDLLTALVEAHQSALRERRSAFLLSQASNRPDRFQQFGNPGFVEGNLADARVLAGYGFLLEGSTSKGTATFTVTPRGIEHYTALKNSTPVAATVEATIRQYLESSSFQTAYPAAHASLTSAASLLWENRSTEQLTTIGRKCREAMQAFATSLAGKYKVDVISISVTSTVKGLQTVLEAAAARRGIAAREFLDALTAYWSTVSDLVQRQEHGAQKENTPLTWEDGRRVVFQTCVVMYEINRALK